MRKLYWILLAGSLGSFAGCNEFIASGERTTAIDVVGEPSDPTTETLGQSDILGSALPMPDDAEALTESSSDPLQPQPFPDDPSDAPESADQAISGDGNRVAKPVSLKSNR